MQSIEDSSGLDYTASAPQSVAEMEGVVQSLMGYRRDIGDRLKMLLKSDADMPMAICMSGYAAMLMGNSDMSRMAAKQLAKVERGASEKGAANDRERMHVRALKFWCDGHLDHAADMWEQILREFPLDGLAVRLAHFAWFYSGDGRKIRDSMARTLPRWSESHPCFGYLLGMYAFGLEESGDYARAEKFGRRAVELNPEDAWSVHAVAHTLEMREKHQQGIDWIEDLEPGWSKVNNFRFHLDWHTSLFYLEKGDYEKVLQLYDTRFGTDVESGYYLDFCNAASGLWRLEIHGLDVDDRWLPLLEVARKHLHDNDLAFLSLHYMMAIAAVGNASDKKALLEHFRAWSEQDNCQGRAMKSAGYLIAQAMVNIREHRYDEAVDLLSAARYQKDSLGGSKAQRDVFDLMLLQSALKGSRDSLCRQLFAERINYRPKSPWAKETYAGIVKRADGTSQSIDKDILLSRLATDKHHPWLSRRQLRLREKAAEIARSEIAPRAAEVDREEAYPWDNVNVLKENGFMGMTVPREFGGRGMSYQDVVLVIEQMAQACGVTGRIVVEGNMGALGAIMKYGSDKQKSLAAGLVLAGDKPAICITEPEAGSAATEMTTTAVLKGDRYVINGKKHWITGGGVSRLHLIFARVVENGDVKGICGFIAVREESKGLIIGRREPTMGLRGIPETEVILEDLEVPLDMVLIPEGGIERGFAGLMKAYNAQRVGAAAVALGIAEGAAQLAIKYLNERRQFGRPIAEFQGLQWTVADMTTGLAAAQALVYKAARSGPGAFPDMVQAAQAKLLASETAIRVTNDALQLHGAAGYSRNQPLERMVRDARMFTIGGGTAQILRTQIGGKTLGIRTPQTRDGYSNQ